MPRVSHFRKSGKCSTLLSKQRVRTSGVPLPHKALPKRGRISVGRVHKPKEFILCQTVAQLVAVRVNIQSSFEPPQRQLDVFPSTNDKPAALQIEILDRSVCRTAGLDRLYRAIFQEAEMPGGILSVRPQVTTTVRPLVCLRPVAAAAR